MRIFEYKISKNIYVKAEITKLTPFPINNDTDNYFIVIPSVISVLPNNVMFIPKTMIIDPHTKADYVPEIVKLGVTLAESISTGLPKGIEIKLLVIDNIRQDLTDVSSITTVRIGNSTSSKVGRPKSTKKVDKEENSKPVDAEQEFLLDMIDNHKEINDYNSDVDTTNENDNDTELEKEEIVQENNNVIPVVKTRRKRRRRDPITGELIDYEDEKNTQ